MQKWQYSHLIFQITNEPGSLPGVSRGKVQESLGFKVYGDTESAKDYSTDQLDELITWLGETGWELVSVTNTFKKVTEHLMVDEIVWYFKKPTDY